jgi:hypothetical protein
MSFRLLGDKGEGLAIQVSKKGPKQIQLTIKAEVNPSLCFFVEGLRVQVNRRLQIEKSITL